MTDTLTREWDLAAAIKAGGADVTVADAELLQRCCELCEARTILEIGTRRGTSALILTNELRKRDGALSRSLPAFTSFGSTTWRTPFRSSVLPKRSCDQRRGLDSESPWCYLRKRGSLAEFSRCQASAARA